MSTADDAVVTGRVPPGWHLAASLSALVTTAVVFAAAGLLLSRIDLVLLAVPLIASAGWAWTRRPRDEAEARLTVELAAHAVDGDLGYTIRVASPGAESVQLRLSTLSAAPHNYVLSIAGARELRGTVPILHSGPQELIQVEFRMASAESAFVSATSAPIQARRVISPPYRAVLSLPLPHRLLGLTGLHDSARPGDGGDFRDIHPFTPGDRLRRIDWKTTARHGQNPGELYVRRTLATSDASAVLVVDSRDDLGENILNWGRNTPAGKGLSSMDVAREAASSIAAGYIGAGDRVGFNDLAAEGRAIALGSGSRHLQRVLRAIELTRSAGAPSRRQRPPLVPSGSIVFVLSTFLDDLASAMALLWRSSGHRVIAVDVLPAPQLAHLNREELVAHRIISAERDERMRRLQASGVEVLHWHDGRRTGLREARLRMLARPGRAPR